MIDATPVQFQEAIDFFKSKTKLSSNAWTDLWAEQNTKAFIVAGAVKTGLVEDFHNAIQKAISTGTTLDEFRNDFDNIVAKHGWSYKGKRGWRSRVIYDTNLRAAFNAGRWQQIEKVKKLRPYLMYIAVQDERTRRSHKAWHGLVYPVGHKFWNTHNPSNGWGCRCTTKSLSARDVKKLGYNVSNSLPPEAKQIRNVKIGGKITQVKTPAGIDPGFDYNVGRNRLTGVTPPPAPGIPGPGNGTAATAPLPTPRSFNPKNLLPSKGYKEEDYANAFLKEFDADIKTPVVFLDKSGEALPISVELFKDHFKEWKIKKSGREIYLRMLAQNIKNPDEIWFDWKRLENGIYQLRRRYLSRFDLTGKQQSGLSVFEITRDGWREVTNFAPKNDRTKAVQDEYMNKQRKGTLIYKRE